MQSLLGRIRNSISFSVNNLIIKYQDDAAIATLLCSAITWRSADASWAPAFAVRETASRSRARYPLDAHPPTAGNGVSAVLSGPLAPPSRRQDYLGGWKTLHRLLQITELSLSLDRREPAGHVEVFQGGCCGWTCYGALRTRARHSTSRPGQGFERPPGPAPP